MKIHYSKDADAFYLRFNTNEITDSDEVAKDVIIDYDETGNIVAIEVLSASEKADVEELIIQAFEKVSVEKGAVV